VTPETVCKMNLRDGKHSRDRSADQEVNRGVNGTLAPLIFHRNPLESPKIPIKSGLHVVADKKDQKDTLPFKKANFRAKKILRRNQSKQSIIVSRKMPLEQSEGEKAKKKGRTTR